MYLSLYLLLVVLLCFVNLLSAYSGTVMYLSKYVVLMVNGERHGEQREAGGGVAGRALATRFPPKSP